MCQIFRLILPKTIFFDTQRQLASNQNFYPDAGERCIRIGAVLTLEEMIEKLIEMPKVAEFWHFAFFSGNSALTRRICQQRTAEKTEN